MAIMSYRGDGTQVEHVLCPCFMYTPYIHALRSGAEVPAYGNDGAQKVPDAGAFQMLDFQCRDAQPAGLRAPS